MPCFPSGPLFLPSMQCFPAYNLSLNIIKPDFIVQIHSYSIWTNCPKLVTLPRMRMTGCRETVSAELSSFLQKREFQISLQTGTVEMFQKENNYRDIWKILQTVIDKIQLLQTVDLNVKGNKSISSYYFYSDKFVWLCTRYYQETHVCFQEMLDSYTSFNITCSVTCLHTTKRKVNKLKFAYYVLNSTCLVTWDVHQAVSQKSFFFFLFWRRHKLVLPISFC